MTEQKTENSLQKKRELLFVQLFLLPVCLTLCHLVHDAWVPFGPPRPVAVHVAAAAAPAAPAVLYAPAAYRVMMPTLFLLIDHVLKPRDFFWILAVSDFVFFYAALSLWFRVASSSSEGASRWQRLLAVGFLMTMIQFPLSWVVNFQRPETGPTALFFALACYALVKSRKSRWWIALMLAAAVFQSFVRSDMVVVYGFALLMLALFTRALEGLGSRAMLAMQGLLALGIGGGVQMYLQLVKFPHLTYPPGVGPFQLVHNLRPHTFFYAVLAFLPFAMAAGLGVARRFRLTAIEVLILVTAVLYSGLWFVVGSAPEVRIVVPVLLGSCVIAARLFAACFAADEA